MYTFDDQSYLLIPLSAVREDRAPGGRPRIKSLIGMKENADTFVSSELITQLIQARPDATPKRRLVDLIRFRLPMQNRLIMFNATDLCFLASFWFESCLSFFLQSVGGKSKTNCEWRNRQTSLQNRRISGASAIYERAREARARTQSARPEISACKHTIV